MAIQSLKKADPPVQAIDTATAETVRRRLGEIQAGREEAVRRYARAGTGVAPDWQRRSKARRICGCR